MVWVSHNRRLLCLLLPFLGALLPPGCAALPGLPLLAVSAARLLRWLPALLRLLADGAQTLPARWLQECRQRLALVLLKERQRAQ